MLSQETLLIVILHSTSKSHSQSKASSRRDFMKRKSRCYINQTGKEMVLWLAKLVCGRRSHEAECCVSSGLIKGRVISLIISSPQNGHSLAIASSSSDRSCLTVRKVCQDIDVKRIKGT